MSTQSPPKQGPSENSGPVEPDDVKDKFKQALERKRGHHADRDAAADRLGSGKAGGERAAAQTKRTFRRKSGG
jgi:hypothetical protein